MRRTIIAVLLIAATSANAAHTLLVQGGDALEGVAFPTGKALSVDDYIDITTNNGYTLRLSRPTLSAAATAILPAISGTIPVTSGTYNWTGKNTFRYESAFAAYDVPFDANYWTSSVAGTGAASIVGGPYLNSTSGATAGGTSVYFVGGNGTAYSPWLNWGDGFSGSVRRINWAREMAFTVWITPIATTTSGTALFVVGHDVAAATPLATSSAYRCVGFQLRDNAIWSYCRVGNGTVTETNLSSSLGDSYLARITVYHNGTGTVSYYKDGVLLGTAAGAPTDQGTENGPTFSFGVTNGADNAAMRMGLFRVQTWMP